MVCVLSSPLDFLESGGRESGTSTMCKRSIFREIGKNMIALKANSICLSRTIQKAIWDTVTMLALIRKWKETWVGILTK